MQDFFAQGSILDIAVNLCVAALVRIIQVISRANILIDVVLPSGRVQVVIPIFPLSYSGGGNKLGLLRSSELFWIARVALWI